MAIDYVTYFGSKVYAFYRPKKSFLIVSAEFENNVILISVDQIYTLISEETKSLGHFDFKSWINKSRTQVQSSMGNHQGLLSCDNLLNVH